MEYETNSRTTLSLYKNNTKSTTLKRPQASDSSHPQSAVKYRKEENTFRFCLLPMSALDIGSLMQQAATLRSHSQKPFRRFFDSSAPWIQQTMYASPEIDRLRNSEDSEAIISYASERKERGNSLFRDGSFQEAQNEYFNSISVLRWMQNTDENWQRKDIDDSTIVRREFVSSDKGRQAEARNLEIAVLLNIARCYQKSSEWTNSILACDEALILNPACTKALCLRAKDRYIPLSSNTSDWELALGDYKQAIDIEPNSQVEKI